ncbi:aminopeptidase [Candidatus Binatia bacterium]|nr:aminopeptidase [Candidatus Binatia bacterium]
MTRHWTHLRTGAISLIYFCGLALAPLLAGCSPTYVLRAGYEEAKILWRRVPIEEMLQEPDLPADTRAKLTLVLAVRTYARDILGLRVGGSYASFAAVDSSQVVHVVTAAYRDRLTPYTWWFPIVGRVPYKGYFNRAEAVREAADLDSKGLDTMVRPSVAFSTLGWFDDPVLSTLLRYDDATLANTVIHELLHNTVYLGSSAAFNESFANFVGHRGAIDFFARHGDDERRREAAADWAAALMFSGFLADLTGRLQLAYAAGITPAECERLLTAAQAEFLGLPFNGRYQTFITRPLNNAVILHDVLYNDRLSVFENAYAAQHNDLPNAIAAIVAAVNADDADPYSTVARCAPAP